MKWYRIIYLLPFLSLSHFDTGLNNGELSYGTLLQQLNNPNINQCDREMLVIALGHFNATSSARKNNRPHPVLANNVRNWQRIKEKTVSGDVYSIYIG